MSSLPLIFVRPGEGRRVRDESGALLPSEGANVPDSPFWLRKLNDGDVVRIDAEPARRKGRGE
jgi:hypothetical protein